MKRHAHNEVDKITDNKVENYAVGHFSNLAMTYEYDEKSTIPKQANDEDDQVYGWIYVSRE
jgi:hypothetical protein